MKKWSIRIAIFVIVLMIAVFFFAKSYITRDYLVAAIEKSINSRIQIKNLDVNLFGISGSVDLHDVIIAPRDEAADQKIPHDQRDPIENGDIHFESVTFNISLWEVLAKKILVEKIDLDGVKINLTLLESGDTSIQKLFAKPSDHVEKEDTFNASENEDFITTINQINLTNVEINLIVEKTQMAVKGRDVYVNLLDINVNPKKLDTVNNAKIKVGGTFDLQSLDSSVEYGKVITTGEADLTLFNTENGDLEPEMIISLTVDSDSYLTDQVPALSKIWKAAGVLNKFGIKSLQIPEKAKFKNDQSVRVGYKLGVSTLLDPLSIKVYDWELEAVAQSWLGSADGMHLLGVKLHIGDAIVKKFGGLLGESASGAILEKLGGSKIGESMIEDGKLTLHVESSGELSDPKIRIKNKLPIPGGGLIDGLLGEEDFDDEDDSLKRAGKDLLRGLLE